MKKKIVILIILAAMLSSCGVYRTMVNLSRLKFKLEGVSNFKLNGFSISDKASIRDFGAIRIIQLTSMVAKKQLPVSFTVNVEAKNPNDGKGGFPPSDIIIKEFPWKLFINDKETISGIVNGPIKVPGVGQAKVIPVNVSFDLFELLKGSGFSDVMNLALALGGKEADAAKLKIIAEPVLNTPIGEMKYPQPITIVSKEFN